MSGEWNINDASQAGEQDKTVMRLRNEKMALLEFAKSYARHSDLCNRVSRDGECICGYTKRKKELGL